MRERVLDERVKISVLRVSVVVHTFGFGGPGGWW